MSRLAVLITLLALSPAVVTAAQLDFSYSNPSFSGVGFSTHVLTMKQLEDQQREKNQNAIDAIKSAEKAAEQNTPQAQFQTNLQSRIYSQLALQITNTLFGATGAPTCGTTCGGTMSVGGNTITWGMSADGKNINITVTNDSNASQFTKMTVPVGAFGF
jgi:hypothetical protein